MKKKDSIALYTILTQLSNIKMTKFAYFVMKNMKILKPEIDMIRELNKLPLKYVEYENKRIEICKKNSEVDEDGKPLITKENRYKIKTQKNFDKKLAELNEEYRETIDERKQKNLKISELLDGDSEIKFHKIKLEYLPELSANQMMILEELIIED